MGRRYRRQTWAERFWSKVDKHGPTVRPELGPCWDWQGATKAGGYGYLGRVPASPLGPQIEARGAHTVSWELHFGEISEVGLCVCHHCDRPVCVNPGHLFLGTRRQNNQDRNTKKRDGDFRGERNPNAKLSAAQVAAIREEYANGARQVALAAAYGVQQAQISRIVRRVSYTGERRSRRDASDPE